MSCIILSKDVRYYACMKLSGIEMYAWNCHGLKCIERASSVKRVRDGLAWRKPTLRTHEENQKLNKLESSILKSRNYVSALVCKLQLRSSKSILIWRYVEGDELHSLIPKPHSTHPRAHIAPAACRWSRDCDVSRSYYQSSNPIGQHFIYKVYVHM